MVVALFKMFISVSLESIWVWKIIKLNFVYTCIYIYDKIVICCILQLRLLKCLKLGKMQQLGVDIYLKLQKKIAQTDTLYINRKYSYYIVSKETNMIYLFNLHVYLYLFYNIYMYVIVHSQLVVFLSNHVVLNLHSFIISNVV